MWIDPAQGFSGDMFAAALIGLGVPEEGMIGALEAGGEELGLLNAHTHVEFLPDDTLAYRLHVLALRERDAPDSEGARLYLDNALKRAGVGGAYAAFARRALTILLAAESRARSSAVASPQRTASLPVVGIAHTLYQHKAPYQPAAGEANDDDFYVEMEPGYAAGLSGLETFSHIFVISYLDRTRVPEMQVQPPWRDGAEQYGVFATRSPNRPSFIGLTRARLRRVEGNRVYTGPLDLFDGTPVLDIKPFIRSLDGMDEDDSGNDGWLAGSEHLELHRRGIPHTHPGSAGHLDDLQNVIATLTAVAWGLQHLAVAMGAVTCLTPVYVGGGLAPATQSILGKHRIPSAPGPGEAELLTPTGVALLAALTPMFVPRAGAALDGLRLGVGLGQHAFDGQPAALRLYI
ncbi:MAG: tRNA (N6-threonylcarbamoyladenosine(37)-N6)-methyltransferase TrmO [Chloroflexi bacterium]|nr:MAG: tRNA (N6-threonylcarbamoyladenosine(37)-N6)-methyltransferase TrmO [Chloroflexota bacterium]